MTSEVNNIITRPNTVSRYYRFKVLFTNLEENAGFSIPRELNEN